MSDRPGRIRSLVIMFFSFFKIGAFTIGGGYAMLPLMEHEFVSRRAWVTEDEMVDMIAVVQSLPGIIALNTSMFIGYRIAGFVGAVIAMMGMLLPSLIIITIFALLYVNIQDSRFVQGAFSGIRAGVTALILLAGIKLGRRVIKDTFSAILAIASFIAVVFLDMHAFIVITCAAAVGALSLGVNLIRSNHGSVSDRGDEQSEDAQ